jgi:hypothetical protein
VHGREEPVLARLVVAVLALVEQEQVGVRAERDGAVGPVGLLGHADARHVLEERAVAVARRAGNGTRTCLVSFPGRSRA